MMSPVVIWNKAGNLGRMRYGFRFVSMLFAVFLFYLHHYDKDLPLTLYLYISVAALSTIPVVMLYHFVLSGNDKGMLMKHTIVDFIGIGWFIGLIHISIIPSFVYALAVVSNYIAIRGFNKLYRLLLLPLGIILPFAIGGFQFYSGHSNWMLISSLFYLSIHFISLASVSYFLAKESNDINKLLMAKNGEIDAQKEEILTQSQRLMELNDHLEEKVEQRTYELAKKN